jgi:hypothetical protein
MVDELKPLIRHTDRKPQPPKDRRAMIALGHAALTLAELVSAVQTARRQAPPPRGRKRRISDLEAIRHARALARE